ncbi:peptidase M19 [Gemmatimonas phototrophica]|uniref:Peptidase M19 n=1 Tax=Gemmatimonas phototrophica TaxID=1379270 RepID=A0A143BPB0_9BACT|nr:peptidase M19 [Gemmatimonas phototrophica]
MGLPTVLAAQSGPPPRDESAILATAKAIHAKVLSIDTHVDISPANFNESGPNYAQKLPRTQVDIVKMEEGGLVGAFLIVYVGQDTALNAAGFARANAQALEKFDAVHRLTDKLAPARAELAYTAADARRIHRSGKRVIFIGVENGFPIGSDIANVEKFYQRGGRYMSLAHNGHSQLSDSNTGERDGVWLHNGLSPLGKQVIAEMNRLGMMIDVSHPSKQSMLQTVALSKAPIIASHSGVRALCNHSRNMDDEQLDALKKNGGVIQLVAFNSYVKCNPAKDAERAAAVDALRKEYGIAPGSRVAVQRAIEALPNDKRNEYLAKQEDITARRYPSDPAATVADFANHIDYVVKRIGINHVGISSDFDGGGGVDGWRNASESMNVTAELVRRGYTAAEIEKIWGGNLLRVMEGVEKVAKK